MADKEQVSQSVLWEEVLNLYDDGDPMEETQTSIINKLSAKYIILPRPQIELMVQEMNELKIKAAELEEYKKFVDKLPQPVQSKDENY